MEGKEKEDQAGGNLDVDDVTLWPYGWAKPIHQLDCDIVFPKELDFAPLNRHRLHAEECTCDADASANTYEALMTRKRIQKSHHLESYTPYCAGVIEGQWIVEKLLTQVGIWPAGVLSWIFADLEGGQVLIEKRYLSL